MGRRWWDNAALRHAVTKGVGVRRNTLFGVNVAGAEQAPWNGQTLPVLADYQYLASKGVGFQRFPIAWESLQPTLSAALDTTYLNKIKAAIDNAWACGIGTIVDLHNFGFYASQAKWTTTVGYAGNAGNPGTGVNVLGDGTLTSAAFVDLWTRLSTALVGRAGLIGYCLMNEPTTGIIGTNLLTTPNYFDTGGDWFTDNSPVLTRLAEGSNPLGANYAPAWSMTSGTGTPDIGQTMTWLNVPYTVSFYGWTNTGTESVSPQIRGSGAAKTLTTTPTRFSNTVTPAAGSGPMRFTFNQASTGHTINIANFQVELGSSPTAFSPNPFFPFAQAAITAIRAVDANTLIYVNGYQGRAAFWTIQNPDMAALVGTGLAFEFHQYFNGAQGVGGDGNYSGSYTSYSIDAQSGVQAIAPAAAWCATHGVAGYLGECGIPGSDANWQTLQNNVFDNLRTNGIKATQFYYGANHSDGDPLNLATTVNDLRLTSMLAR